jgi:hypothetical protein
VSSVSTARADPLQPTQWWLSAVVPPDLAPPPVTDRSPLIGILDAPVDLGHPEFQGARLRAIQSGPVDDRHGTAVASVASAPLNGRGIAGVWPGARVLVVANRATCASYVKAVKAAVRAGAAVLNMSYGWDLFYDCPQHTIATNWAFSKGVVLVAAAGNDRTTGSNMQIPGHDPHVLTVSGVTPSLTQAPDANLFYSDVVAPAVGIVAAVPVALDRDGTPDGYTTVNGTSFASPMVAAAAAWLKAARPELDNTQILELLERTARDLGKPGWDDAYGWGFIDLARALRDPAPVADPSEVNDDIEWVDGRRLGRPKRPIFRPGDFHRELVATLDDWDDSFDVYRVVLPPRTSVRCLLVPDGGDADMQVYGRRSRSIWPRGIGGRHPGRANDDIRRLEPLFDPRRGQRSSRRVGTDRVVISNATHRRRTAYLAVYMPTRVKPPDVRVDTVYRLDVKRLPSLHP